MIDIDTEEYIEIKKLVLKVVLDNFPDIKTINIGVYLATLGIYLMQIAGVKTEEIVTILMNYSRDEESAEIRDKLNKPMMN